MFNIDHVTYYVPKRRLDLIDHFDQFSLTEEQAKVFTKIYGLRHIPQAAHTSLEDFLSLPVEKLIKDLSIDSENIKVLIHAHTAKVITVFGQSIVQSLKKKLNFKSALSFGTSVNNCASTLNAFEMAACLLKNFNKDDRAIVITGEKAFTDSIKVIPNTSITGDAAAAALISLSGEKNQLLSLEMLTCGKFSKGVWLNPLESKDFESHYVGNLTKTIHRAVKKSGLSLADIKIILPHNVNLISWKRVAKELNFPLKKIYLKNVGRYAHCFGSDILINFAEAYQEGLLNRGDYYLMATVGLGAIFAAAVFRH